MDEFEFKDVSELISLIDKRVQQKVSEYLTGYIQKKVGKIISADNTAMIATVRLTQSNSNGSEDLAGLKNCTGSSLAVNDSVWIYYTNNLSNAYIAVKK